MRTLLLSAALLVAAVLLIAETAAAAELDRPAKGATLSYTETDLDTSVNDLDIDYCDQSPCATSGILRFRDLGDEIEVGPASGCTGAGTTVPAGTVVACVRSGVPRVAVSLGGADDRLTIDGGGFPGQSLPVPLVVTGGPGGDALDGGVAADTLIGGDGADTLNAFAGADTVLGGSGNDTIEARDGVIDVVDCGADVDASFTDPVDSADGCEPPAAGAPSPPPPPTPPAPQPVALKQMATTLSFVFFPRRPRATTRFGVLTIKEVPPGSLVAARCIAPGGRRCGGTARRTFTTSPSRRNVALKRFLRRFRAGTRIEVTVSNPAFVTQVKILRIRRNRTPDPSTRCVQPGTTKRVRCG